MPKLSQHPPKEYPTQRQVFFWRAPHVRGLLPARLPYKTLRLGRLVSGYT